GSPILGLLGLRPDEVTGAGTDPLEVEQIAFQAATLLESVRHQQRNARERRFRECLLEAMGDGLLATDGSGRITALNRTAQALLAVERDSLLGEPIEKLADAAPQLVASCRQSLASGHGVEHEEILLATGRQRIPASLSIVPLGEVGESGGGIVVTLSDLRPVRAMEQEMRRLDRLAALGRFASAVAHEIRNPLAAIGAGVDFLATHVPETQHDDLNLLRGEIQRLDRIVRDLLEPARRQPLEKVPMEAAKLVQRSCQAVEPLARERGVRFSVRPPLEETLQPARVAVDADRMVQVLVNLVRNATEASPAGAEVEIGWRRQQGEPSTILQIWIEDRGCGIAPEHLPHIFEPFYSTKSGGTGLGLYVSHGLVEQHGGELRVEPVASGGTRMVLDLPSLEAQEDGCPLRS
ncbi:MAG: ATP-binding protein, partial [Candidatus Eisenbacteria bacterium]|nr:ATP-binding protein [Candidatus Eisenbacteria bacterium]